MAHNQDSTRPSTGKLHNELKQNVIQHRLLYRIHHTRCYCRFDVLGTAHFQQEHREQLLALYVVVAAAAASAAAAVDSGGGGIL